ncbi:MAG: hypothetical protein K0B14_19525 [Anaerolineaceae bacterium]|nr:hypothetical protein [Anaerolineaceae bacterium]
MTTKDYSDPKTVEEIIEQCRWLQEDFNSEINLDYLEKAIEMLDNAIENSPEDDPSREKYIYERNRLYNRYPDLDEWLSEPRYDYQLDIRYNYEWFNENNEYLDREIIIKYLSEENRKREKDMQEFFDKHKEIFVDQFDYALVGFEGERYSQVFDEKMRSQNWIGIFLDSQGYPDMAFDETFIIRNAPPLDADSKIYLPVKPNTLDKKTHKFPDQKDKNRDCSSIMPIDVDLWDFEGEQDTSKGYFEFTSQLINKIVFVSNLLNTKDINDLDINSFHFLIDLLHLNEDVYEKIKNPLGVIEECNFTLSGDPSVIDKKLIPSTNWSELRRLTGNREEKIFGTIEITKNGYVKMSLVLNNHYSADLNYEYLEYNSDSFEILSDLSISAFLAMFSD